MKRGAELKRTPFARSGPKPANGPKLKSCKVCREKFTPRTPLQTACSPLCAAAHGTKVTAQQKAKQARHERAQDKAKRDALKSRSDWVKEAQAAVNTYVRIRDEQLPCISCGITYPDDRRDVWDAGHMRSAGSSPATRLNTLNIHKQCVRCNRYLSSNAIKYRIGAIEKIGIDLVEMIESINGPAKFSIEYLARFKTIFRKRARHLTNLRERIGNGKGKSRGL